MKKFFKALALVLALALVVGVVPAQSASAKIKAKKVLYTATPTGWSTTDDTLKSSLKTKVRIYTLAGDKKAVAADHEYNAIIKSGEDIVYVTEKYVVGKKLGKAVVEIFKDGESLGTSVITVRKNADAETLKLVVKEGEEFVAVTADTEFVAGVTYRLALPRAKADSDERRLTVDDKAIDDVEGSARQYDVTFDEGEHTIAFEAFQGGKLDGYTVKDSIKITAKTPAAKSAKQVSANSFAVTFDHNMTGLIDKDKINNQDIYYLIAKQPVVTGVIKSVAVSEEDPKVVTVEMFAKFNSDTDYYFAYGDSEPVKFHTAKNELKYVASIELVEAKAYYVGEDTQIAYKFFNEDGVELEISDIPALEVVSDNAYGIGTNIYFHTEGTATIKASIVTGYDDDTNEAKVLKDEIKVTGVKKTTTQTGKVYSFSGDVNDAKHSIRVTNAAGATKLLVKYTLSDGAVTLVDSTSSDYYLKSTDETVAMIAGSRDTVYGINPGTATIVLYDNKDAVLDAFPITVLEANKVGSATATLSKETLNLSDLGTAGATDDDYITLTVNGFDLDGEDSGAYSVEVKQLDNNAVATSVGFATIATNSADWDSTSGAERKVKISKTAGTNTVAPTDSRSDKTGFATVRIVVTVKNGKGETVLAKTLSFVVSEQATANAYKLTATSNALDNSLKNWGTANLAAKTSSVGVSAVRATSYGDFFVSNEDFALVKSVANIPVTATSGTVVNYVIMAKPTVGSGNAEGVTSSLANFVQTGTTLTETELSVDLAAFPSTSTRAQTGTYSFTGYHVAYGADQRGVRSTLGSQNVVISRSDVQGTVTIVNGKAANFDTFKATKPTEIFKVNWADLSTNADNTGRVVINPLAVDTNYTYDNQSGAYYCKKITITVKIDNAGAYSFTQDIAINKLFKND